MKQKWLRIPIDLRVALLYALFGGAWILFSDRLLAFLVQDMNLVMQVQTYKGWAFVAFSALLIYFGVHRYILLQGKAEAALRESLDRYHTTLDNMLEGCQIIAPDWRYVYVNPAAARHGRRKPEELFQHTMMEAYPGIEKTDLFKALEACMAGRTSDRLENEFTYSDGSTGWFELSIEPVPEGLFILSIDITERKRAEAKAERQVQRLASLGTIDMAITSSLDLAVTLNILLERVCSQLNADAADVLLLRPGLNMLEYAAGRGFRTNDIAQLSLQVGENYAGRAVIERRPISVSDLESASPPFARPELAAGEGFRSFNVIPLIAKGEVKGVLEVFHRTPFSPDSDWQEFFVALARQAAIAIDNAELFTRLQRSNDELLMSYDLTIEGWSHALDLRDKETEGHTQRVTEMTVKLAERFGFDEEAIVHVRRGALLHDIGKMGVPDAILLKPGELTEEEWVLMRRHPVYAYEMLSPIPYLRLALDIPHYHHEKWDGSGYPEGLKGEQIPLAARLFAVVDVWDALSSDRPYRPAWPEGKIYTHLRENAGVHFDPRVADVFLKMRGEGK
ncbi:MAG: HD domain-containing phosphohydrolase [Chloroflexota bacterium]